MRQEVIELGKLGPIPSSDIVINQKLDKLIEQYGALLMSIAEPVTDAEARILMTIFGVDDGFGLAQCLISLIETAPGWPLEECLQDESNEWVQLLKIRVENSKVRTHNEKQS